MSHEIPLMFKPNDDLTIFYYDWFCETNGIFREFTI